MTEHTKDSWVGDLIRNAAQFEHEMHEADKSKEPEMSDTPDNPTSSTTAPPQGSPPVPTNQSAVAKAMEEERRRPANQIKTYQDNLKNKIDQLTTMVSDLKARKKAEEQTIMDAATKDLQAIDDEIAELKERRLSITSGRDKRLSSMSAEIEEDLDALNKIIRAQTLALSELVSDIPAKLSNTVNTMVEDIVATISPESKSTPAADNQAKSSDADKPSA